MQRDQKATQANLTVCSQRRHRHTAATTAAKDIATVRDSCAQRPCCTLDNALLPWQYGMSRCSSRSVRAQNLIRRPYRTLWPTRFTSRTTRVVDRLMQHAIRVAQFLAAVYAPQHVYDGEQQRTASLADDSADASVPVRLLRRMRASESSCD